LEGYGLGWQNVAGFAKIAYLYTPQDKRDSAVYDYYRNELFAAADAKINTSSSDGYLTTLNLKDYGWGSNMNLMNDGMLLILANLQKPDGKYVAAVMNNLHFLMGCNALSQNYVTGFGSKTVLNPHHRMSKSDNAEAPVPGLVAGGPNANLEDDIAKSSLKNKPAARCYIDNSGSYSTNEIAVYWNSPAVFVAAFVD
jgi:endoglucanase